MSEKSLQPEILWHYCSNESFVSIVKSRSIRLSSLSLSNDFMEGKLIQSLLKNEISKPLGRKFNLKSLNILFSIVEGYTDGLGFCLSEKSDQLSQWRGYADNAQGVAIGLSKKILDEQIHNLNGNDTLLERVVYSEREHEEILRPILQKIIELAENGRLKEPKLGGLLVETPEEKLKDDIQGFNIANQEILDQFWLIREKLFLVKSGAFSEESEWRILKITDRQYEYADFYARGATIVPFIKLGLPSEAIKQVITGSKNNTPPDVIKMMLENDGFKTTSVTISNASYR